MNTVFDLIEKMRESLRAEFDVDAENDIRDIDRAIESEIAKNPLLAFASNLFYRAGIRLRQQRITLARKQQSDGFTELLPLLEQKFWDGRVLENLRAMRRPDERLLEVDYWVVVTSQRRITRSEAKAFGRMMSEANDAFYARQFVNDDRIREAEAAERSRVEQPLAPGRTGVTNSDWRR